MSESKNNMQISILRLGHRLPRDERITTHVALVARAFGASEIIYTGQHDGSLESSVSRLAKQCGGEFNIRYEKNYEKVINNYKKNGSVIVHLTMYGLPVLEVLGFRSWVSKLKIAESGALREICPKDKQTHNSILVIVGGEQVPKDVYELADFNISITSQPHSEVAALAVFLDHLRNSKALEREFDKRFNGKIKIEPSERGKKAISSKD